ncbi:hypothetical protein KL912_001793 [Ogataea haglerorum]|nr:hypothetical protein KL912_001793 [Ogataea haglerorum]
MTLEAPLPQGAGYAVVVGLGFVFSLGMIMTTFVLRRYQKEIITAEEFVAAGRSVKTGLIAAAVVRFYYASGATVQIILFAFIAIKAKQRAPEAHTYLEIVKARYGTAAHAVYMFFAIATNILVTAMLLTGGSAVISDLTGMNTVAACFLLPIGVVVYTLFGGIKATFLTDYAHTIAIIVIILTFAFTTYVSGDVLGSTSKVYDLVMEAAKEKPIKGNAHGSYFTMNSRSGGIFFVINIVGNFGTVFLDNGYWNKAIASSPAAALPGYIFGGLAWFAVPWLVSISMGLACVALEKTPAFPSYPNPLTADEVSAGLVLPSAAVAMMGKGGAVAALIVVFMAVTSASSAEFIAVSSIFSYDIYKGYINPQASGKTLILTSHASVIVFSLVMSGFATGLYYAGISMGYLYELMGIIISSAVFPATLTLLSRKQNVQAVVWSPILGTAFAIMSWLVCTKKKFGSITVDTTFEDDAMLTGNVVALLSPLIFVPILTFAFGPQNFDWEILKTIKRVDETEEIIEATEPVTDTEFQPVKSHVTAVAHDIYEQRKATAAAEEEELLRKASKIAGFTCLFMAISLLVLWPMPMYGSKYIFSKKFFTGWVTVGIIWLFISAFIVIIYPLWEGRHGIYVSMRGIYWDLSGQTWKLREWQNEHPEELHVVQSQVSAEIAHERAEVIDRAIEKFVEKE